MGSGDGYIYSSTSNLRSRAIAALAEKKHRPVDGIHDWNWVSLSGSLPQLRFKRGLLADGPAVPVSARR